VCVVCVQEVSQFGGSHSVMKSSQTLLIQVEVY